MMITKDYTQERQELERVLASGIFDRAPSLAQVLAYVCEKYFEGTGQELKEYSIAVDALGRSTDFDQKKDSIVRVQVHRLRDRLAEYYTKDGASHSIIIEIPQGQYVPRFISRSQSLPPEAHVTPSTPGPEIAAQEISIPPAILLPPSETASVPQASQKWLLWLVATGCLGLLGVFALLNTQRTAAVAPVTSPGVNEPQVLTPADSVRISAGLEKGSYTDGFGNLWEADRYFEGGSVITIQDRPIRGTREPKLYQNRRQGIFSYHIPLKPGVYELRLHFAETHFGENNLAGLGGEGSRAFRININGKTALTRLDVIGEAGSSTAHVRAFKDISPAEDGKLHLEFTPLASVPFLNAIEITPGDPGRFRPIRIVMQDRAYTDPQGRVWSPDRYAIGGQIAKRPPLEVAPDPYLYAGERFGNLEYLIPVPPGRYGIIFYMAERWVGPGMPGGGVGEGRRVFDILANGVFLVRDVDVYKRAGGPDRPLVQTFHGLEPNHQGYLKISLVPFKNFPMLSALEIVDETR